MVKPQPLTWGVIAIVGTGFSLGVLAFACGVASEVTQYTDGLWHGPAGSLGIAAMALGLGGVAVPTISGYLASATGSAIPSRLGNCITALVVLSWVLELLSEVLLLAAVLEDARKSVTLADGSVKDQDAQAGVYTSGGAFAFLASIVAAVAFYLSPKEPPRPDAASQGFQLASTGF